MGQRKAEDRPRGSLGAREGARTTAREASEKSRKLEKSHSDITT